MNAANLKLRIKKKFGSLSKFAERAGINRIELQKYLASPAKHKIELQKISKTVHNLKKVSGERDLYKKLEPIRKAIMDAGGVNAFCQANPQFNSRSIFQILQGRRKLMSEGVQKLFNHFNDQNNEQTKTI